MRRNPLHRGTYARIAHSELYDYTDILLWHERGRVRYAGSVQPAEEGNGNTPGMLWQEVEEGTSAPPTLRLSRSEFMALADAVLDHLEDLGILDRAAPERYKAELNATMRHLHDLRLVAFQSLGVEEPEPMIVRKDGENELPTR